MGLGCTGVTVGPLLTGGLAIELGVPGVTEKKTTLRNPNTPEALRSARKAQITGIQGKGKSQRSVFFVTGRQDGPGGLS